MRRTVPANRTPLGVGRARRIGSGAVVAALIAGAAGAGAWVITHRGEEPVRGRAVAPAAPVAAPRPAAGVFRGPSREDVERFERWSGRRVAYVVDYPVRETWAQIADPRPMLREWKDSPYTLVLGVPLRPESGFASMEHGAEGDYDRYFRLFARRLVAAGQEDAILRVGWEFNSGRSVWRTKDPQTFVAYYRRVVATMRAVPGQRFRFDWNVNNGITKFDAVAYWPGGDVVDFVGVDAYDVSWAPETYPYPADCDAACRAERQEHAWQDVYAGDRGLRHWADFATMHGKPLSLPEWGLWGERSDGRGGGDNPDFVRRMHDFMGRFRVGYEAYFEAENHLGTHRLMTDFPKAAAEYRRLFGSG